MPLQRENFPTNIIEQFLGASRLSNMKYDENGNAQIEPPEVPTELVIHYIVKDYQRMYYRTQKLERENARLRTSLQHVNSLQYANQRTIYKLSDGVRHCVKLMRKAGVAPTSYLQNVIIPLLRK